MCNALDKLFANGFNIDEKGPTYQDFALLSLRASLQAYFSTFAAIGRTLSSNDSSDRFNHPAYPLGYLEAYMSAVIHAHHFLELATKQILRREHELLALTAQRDHLVLFKLIRGTALGPNELDDINTPEFSEALARLCALVKAEVVSNSHAHIVATNHAFLQQFNTLRNRLWHRGRFCLHYQPFDELYGRHLLPVLADLASVYPAAGQSAWMYRTLACGIDPIKEIRIEYARTRPPPWSLEKVALLKEMARAAYLVPARIRMHCAQSQAKVLQIRARDQADVEYATDVKVCPVCGFETLLVFSVSQEMITNTDDNPDFVDAVSEVKCTCCTFQVPHTLKNPSAHGFAGIPNIF